MNIILPDKSIVNLDEKTLKFTQILEVSLNDHKYNSGPVIAPFNINCEVLASFMSAPTWKFGESFRRVSDEPAYSPIFSVHEFDVQFLTQIFQFPGRYRGGTFSSSDTSWRFLDGGIYEHNGYGWGSHYYTYVFGAEALRAVCLFFGIKQPKKIKGETQVRPLARLLEEMTNVPLQDFTQGLGFGLPYPPFKRSGTI